MEWESKYSSGIEEIDDQHKRLLRLFSIVQNEVETNQGWSSIHYSIVEVINFARFHFQFEEALMRLYGFPGFEKHSKAHQQIVAHANRIVADTLGNITRDDVTDFLRNWLITHIQRDDQAYARYILSGAKVVASAATR